MEISEEELLIWFKKVQKSCIRHQEYLQKDYQETLGELQKIQDLVRRNSLFSPNQLFTEIHTNHLPYLLIPYYIGDQYGRLTSVQQRQSNILQSKDYLQAFIKLMLHYNKDYQIFPKVALDLWNNLEKQQGYKPSRDEVIGNQKFKMQLRKKYEKLQSFQDEESKRQVIITFLQINIVNAIKSIKMINQELPLLRYKKKIENQQKAFIQHQKQIKKPLPKLKYWKIDQTQTNQNIAQIPQVQEYMNKNIGQVKMEKIAKIYQMDPKYMPTMTNDQVDQMQYNNMMERQARQKKFRQQNKQDTDSDKEEVDDRKKKKARNFQNWKDENEKGSGNRGNL